MLIKKLVIIVRSFYIDSYILYWV